MMLPISLHALFPPVSESACLLDGRVAYAIVFREQLDELG